MAAERDPAAREHDDLGPPVVGRRNVDQHLEVYDRDDAAAEVRDPVQIRRRLRDLRDVREVDDLADLDDGDRELPGVKTKADVLLHG